MKNLLGKGKTRNGKSLIFFISSVDTHAFVWCFFSTDYTDFSGGMTYFSAALPPPPSWTQSESVIMCLLCIFHSCLGDGCGDSERYLTSKGLAMNSTQCVSDQPLFKHPAPGTEQVLCKETPANSSFSQNRILYCQLWASFICCCDAGSVALPFEHSSSSGTAQVDWGRAHSLRSLSAFLEYLLCIPSGLIPSFLPQVLKISCGPQETSDEVHQSLGWL